jgi:hypothetical protein
MKLATRVRPVTGEELRTEPDTSLIQVGVTTRAEILQWFAAFDAGWKGERLFVGRWLRSGFSVNVADENGRVWEGRNLLVEFSEKGIVLRYQVLPDQRLLDELPRVLSTEKRMPELEYSTSGTAIKIDNATGKQFLDLSGGDAYLSWTCRIAPEQVERLSAVSFFGATDVPVTGYLASNFVLDIHLREKIQETFQWPNIGGPHPIISTSNVKNVEIHTDLPTVALLVHLLSAKQ